MSDTVEWGYEGAIGPTCWGSLSPEFSLCDCGKEQSPINIERFEVLPRSPVEFDYRSVPAGSGEVIDTGTTIQLNCPSGGGIGLDGVRYDLVQLHFHHGSEHLVQGRRFAMEMHLVHRSAALEVAVVAVLLQEGAHNPAFDAIWRHLPGGGGVVEGDDSPANVPANVDLASLLPVRRSAWRYRGSLTTPPCSEGVRWLVLTEPLSLSAAQIAAYGAVHPRSYRPVQPLGVRVLVCDAPPSDAS